MYNLPLLSILFFLLLNITIVHAEDIDLEKALDDAEKTYVPSKSDWYKKTEEFFGYENKKKSLPIPEKKSVRPSKSIYDNPDFWKNWQPKIYNNEHIQEWDKNSEKPGLSEQEKQEIRMLFKQPKEKNIDQKINYKNIKNIEQKNTFSSKDIGILKRIGSNNATALSNNNPSVGESSISANVQKDPFHLDKDRFLKPETLSDQEIQSRHTEAISLIKRREIESRMKNKQLEQNHTLQKSLQSNLMIENQQSMDAKVNTQNRIYNDLPYVLCYGRSPNSPTTIQAGCIKTYYQTSNGGTVCTDINGQKICVNSHSHNLCQNVGIQVDLPFSHWSDVHENLQSCLDSCNTYKHVDYKSSCHGLVTNSNSQHIDSKRHTDPAQQKNIKNKNGKTSAESAFDAFDREYMSKKTTSSNETSKPSCPLGPRTPGELRVCRE